MKKLLHKHTLVYVFLTLIGLAKFLDISGHFVLAEPDTIIYQELTKNLSHSFYPTWSGLGWYFGLPLYAYLSFLVSLLVRDINFSLITVSLLSSILLSWGIYWYISRKTNRNGALLCSLAFILSPMMIYYSRIGLQEMTVTSFSFLFLFLFDYGRETKRFKFSIASGIFLGLALLTKYSSLIFFLVPVLAFLLDGIDFLYQKKVAKLRFSFFYSFISVFLAGCLAAPVVILFLLHDKFRFVQLTKASIFESPEFWGTPGLHLFLSQYSSLVPQLVGWGALLCAGAGLVYLGLKKFRGWELFILSLVLDLALIINRSPTPRYFVICVPFLVILIGLGLYWLVTATARFITKESYRVGIVGVVFALLSLPLSAYAFNSNNHSLVEESARFIASHNQGGKPVFASFWPNLFSGAGTGDKTSWLTDSPWDQAAYGKDWPKDKNSRQILETSGGYVIIEDLYSKELWKEMDRASRVSSNVRKIPAETIEKIYQPIQTIEDHRGNYPAFPFVNSNTARIYEIIPGT